VDAVMADASEGPLATEELGPGALLTFTKQYRVLGRLGEGGMGKVLKAFDPIMNRYVALKVMKADVPESEQRRFRQEARLLGGFMHPGLVRVLDVGTTPDKGLYWFVMEFLEGKDIGGALATGRPVPLHVVCEIFRQVLDALHYVHLRRIVHRDVKPANMFVTRDVVDPERRPVKLLDFGVAKDLDAAPHDEPFIVGDPRYLPPEQSRPNGRVDPRSDVYALGMSFFEAITAHHPFEDSFHDARALLRCQRERAPELPSTFMPADTTLECAQAVDDFFATACAKDPADRFANARAMQNALAAISALT
jgi:serine/threonine-protein kinase